MAASGEVGGGAVGSPFTGERIPHKGEHAAIERFHRGALSPFPSAYENVERRLLSVTHTATDPFPHNSDGINGEVGPTGRSSLLFALCFSDLGLGFGNSVFVDSRSISCSFTFPSKIYNLARQSFY
jgi:hypothetical protein